MGKKTIIGIVIILLLLLFWLFAMGKTIDIQQYGHGKISKSSFSSFTDSLSTILGITPSADYIDEETGIEYCYDLSCWEDAETEYGRCVMEAGYVDADFSSSNTLYSYIEIIPAVHAIAPDFPEFPFDCEEEYDRTMSEECATRCENELYVWDGTPVTNIGEFSQYAFPDYTTKSEMYCESFFIGGEWVSESNSIGCTDASWIFCDSESTQSAANVCNVIGYDWTCDANNAVCSR